ncbi:MAG: ABC transporter permease [Bacteroidetes bacterium]|nr:ABC transporter permease [Bacteroidota bacterium]
MNQLIRENIRISISAVRSHFVRSMLTILIIAFGIMALVGILTSIDAIKYFFNENFTAMGANTLTIRNRSIQINMGGDRKRPRYYPVITIQQANEFKEGYDFPAKVAIYYFASGSSTAKYGSVKTNPNIRITAGDENYMTTSGDEVEKGRAFSANENFYGTAVVVIGGGVKDNLFKNKEDPIGKIIQLGGAQFRVIGVLKSRGSGIGFNSDNSCIIPLNTARQYFPRANVSYTINIMALANQNLEGAEGEAMSKFRIIRKNRPYQDPDFEISKSDVIAKMLFDQLKYLSLAAKIIGGITLFGAAIGLMNIMLVSVTERTREIGIRKAIGANRKTIRNQFLVEAIFIAQLGGILGVFLGILIGNLVSYLVGSSFIIPWVWMILGFSLCFIVALVSGIIPALKASNLDPIESLRYE